MIYLLFFPLHARGLAFHGSDQTFGSFYNESFLGSLELLAEYDLFLAKHSTTHGNRGKGSTCYLSAYIGKEFIQLLGDSFLQAIGN